jgi:hypothetical protein
MRTAFFLKSLFLIVLFSGCRIRSDSEVNQAVNFKDTLFEVEVIYADSSDTIKQHNKIYFTPTDFSIDTSNFYYTACKQPCSEGHQYKVYFNRQAVVSFCDSMLRAIPTYKNQGDEVLFYERISYEHIRERAKENKKDDVIYVDELPILLERFNPLIVNSRNNDKPTYIINRFESRRIEEYKTYNIRSNTGDTILLAIKTIRPTEIEFETK